MKTKKATKTVQKKSRTVRKTSVKTSSVKDTVVKPYVFRSPEARHLGDEPTWEDSPTDKNRLSRMARAFSWYTYYFQSKEAKEMLLQWLTIKGRDSDLKKIRSISDGDFPLTVCWMSRMDLMGFPFSDTELSRIDSAIDGMLSIKTPTLPVEEETKKPNIQDRLLDKVKDAALSIDELWDDFLRAGLKIGSEMKPINVLRAMNVAPQSVGYITDCWTRDLQEFKAVLTGKDKELSESYDKYTKTQIKSMIKFAEMVLADVQSYIQVKKTERKPRAKKIVSPEKLSLKFKFLKEFTELKLKSEPPAKLVAAQEAWLYDVTKRKLIHVVADSNVGSLTVKGTSVIGFDSVTTTQKTLRKPAETIKQFLKEGKPALRKAYKELTTTETKWIGRSNENIVILRVW